MNGDSVIYERSKKLVETKTFRYETSAGTPGGIWKDRGIASLEP